VTLLRREYSAAKAICRRHARSFFFASHFLPRGKRRHAYAVYAFCRGIDDAVDNAPPGEVEAAFAAFTRTLDSVYSGPLRTEGMRDEQRLALAAFADTVEVREIPKAYFLDLAEGCRMDLGITRYETWAGLEKYCYHVAGVVGLIMCRVFGLTEERALANAVTMGNAMQLTNILRDIDEDYLRGRVYLPAEDLARFGVTEQQIASRLVTPGLGALMRFEIERARGLFMAGAEGLSSLPNDGSRLTACAMAVIYAGILGAIERQELNPFAGRARLSLRGKLARIPAAVRLSRRKPDQPVPAVF
jgi:15-cis-phytoene synthase